MYIWLPLYLLDSVSLDISENSSDDTGILLYKSKSIL